MERFIEGILRWRWLVLACCAAMVVLSLLSLSRAVIASSVAELFLGESPEYRAFLEQAKTFGNDEIGIFVIPTQGLFDPEGAARLRAVEETIEAMSEVARVLTLLDVQQIRGAGDALIIESFAERAARGEPPAELLDSMQNEPLVRGTLLSSDGRHTAVIVELATDKMRAAERLGGIIDRMLEAFVAEGYPEQGIRRAGPIIVMSEVMKQTAFSIKTIFPVSAILLLLAVWILFRRLWPSLLSLVIALLAVLFTMGLAVAVDPKVSILMSMVPAVVMIVSFSDVVHLVSAYLLELERGLSKAAAIRAAASDVGRACLYTSLTTFVGFVSLSLIPTPAFRVLGLVMGFGVAVALLLAVTLTPIAFSFLPAPKALRAGTTGKMHGLLDRALGAMHRLVIARPGRVVLAFGLLLITCGISLAGLNFETRFSERLSADNRIRQDQGFMQTHFGGTNLLEIYVDAGELDGLLAPEVMQGMARLEAMARAMPEVAATFSLVDLLETMQRVLAPEAETTIPGSREGIAQALLLFEVSGGESLERLIDPDRQRMHLTVRLPDEGFRETARLGRRLVLAGRALLPETVRIWSTGHTLLFGQWIDEVIKGQRRALGLSVLVIALMMIFAVRSLRMGLWSMVPNVLPLLVLGAWVSLFWSTVDTDTMMVAMLAIGIGVDDTIHFLTRYRIERMRGARCEQAIEATYNFAGRAIVMTTVILVVGFLPFATSEYFSTRILGTLLPMVLGAALLADLLLVPALLELGLMEIRRPGPRGSRWRAPRPPGSTGP